MMRAPDFQSGSSTAVPLAATAGFFFCARAALTFAFVRGFGAPEQLGSAVSIAFSFLLLTIVTVDRCCSSGELAPQAPSTVRWVLLYLGFTGLSLSWSTTVSVSASAAYFAGTAADVLTTMLLLRTHDMQSGATAMMKGYIAGACAIAAIAWIIPAEYDLRLGDQQYLNANTIANLCVFGFFFAQYLAQTTRTRWSAVSVALALTVLRSLSKATMAAFAISAALLFIADRSMRRRTKLLLACAAILAVLSLWGLFEAYYDLYTTTGNQAETLTGRTAIWAYAADAIPERLLFGHGFDSMWKVVPAFGTFQARHAKNEVLEQLYAFGLIGFGLVMAIYASLFRAVRRNLTGPRRLPITCLLAYVVIRGLAEAEPFDLLLPLWAAVLLSYRVHAQRDDTTVPNPAVRPLRPPFESVSTDPTGAA